MKRTIGIIGTGAMGQGIAYVAAAAGMDVFFYDAKPGQAGHARRLVGEQFARQVAKGRLDQGTAEAAIDRIRCIDSLAACAQCGLVIEAIIEDLPQKLQLFKELEEIVNADCILATNTSSLSVTAIAAACRNPARVAGFHFFNPVPQMKVVEVIAGMRTSSQTVDFLEQMAKELGHAPVRATDSPGFIVNHAGRAFVTEALRIVQEGIAEHEDVDAVMRDAAQFRMGPFELLDLTGLDVSHPVMESMYQRFYDEPRFRPSHLAARRVAAGLLGRKTGEGFYRYADGVRVPRRRQLDHDDILLRPVWISRRDRHLHAVLHTLLTQLRADIDESAVPGPDAICLVYPFGQDASSCAADQKLDASRVVAIDTLMPLSRRRTLMGTTITAPAIMDSARALFGRDCIPVTVIRDSPGFIAQRILAMIVSVATDMAQQRIATPQDIELAVRLGLGYPMGPLALGDQVGAENIVSILQAMHEAYADPRYRPSVWLTRRSRLGVTLQFMDEPFLPSYRDCTP